MRKSQRKIYTSAQFTLGDLREILFENDDKDDMLCIDIVTTPGDRPYESSSYSIIVRES